MKFNNPLPQPLSKECEKAAKIFQSFVDHGNNGLDGVIPRSILENAKGFAIFTIFKAGFVFSARAGSGVVIAKLDDGTWSAPSAIGTAGLGVGTQIGAEVTDFLIVLNSRAAIKSFMAAGSLSLGGNMSVALGPLGRNGEASGAVNTNGKVAAMYSYSKTRGLFGGVSLEGSVIVERQDANFQAYDSPVTARLLLGGSVDPPQWAIPLIKTLEACTGMPGTRKWINDEGSRTPGGTYVFGKSPTSSRSSMSRIPSFLRKKKTDSPSFPPASWAAENDSDSYFNSPAPQATPSHLRNKTWDAGDYHSKSGNFDSQDGYGASKSQLPSWDSDFGGATTTISRRSTNPFNVDPTSTTGGYGTTPEPISHQRSLSLKYERPSYASPFQESTQANLFSSQTNTGQTWASQTSSLKVTRAIALYDFNAVQDGDISFRKGDVIEVTQKSDSTDDWWTGRCKGQQGIFPANFVELL
ncbi:hypothetical protein D9613_002068 [Agrocybe pediades]|uniref:SH3 domain-containing protein n=1 Tax=Agrocybe pediades TaxID=84607 RepID=A0A8H4VV55_9AGAR|nr:hypothetical protein D9613_002068 [Agrocybe pediades]